MEKNYLEKDLKDNYYTLLKLEKRTNMIQFISIMEVLLSKIKSEEKVVKERSFCAE